MAAISIFFYFLLFSFSEATTKGGGGNGFTTTLVHRDSPLSPLHNPSLSRYDRLINAFRRSFSRSAALLNRVATVSTSSIHSPIIPDDGEFIMSVSIGTPPVEFIAIADTGSDLTWTQCSPCLKCFNQSHPIFNPRGSSSYRPMPCTADTCRSFFAFGCGPDLRTCTYKYSYGDKSFTNGDIAYDKITIGSFKLRNTIIGCGHQNEGTFSARTTGIIGLGGGSISLVSQMRKTGAVKRRFSYCFPILFTGANVTSKINFGRNAVVSGHEVVSTPIVSKFPTTYYHLTLEAISVANKRFEAVDNVSLKVEPGNIFIDSGTTLTFLPRNLYNGVVSALVSVIRAKRVEDPSKILELCYAATKIDDLNIPIITAHFSGNAAVKLSSFNTFATVAPNVTCLTFAPASYLAVFGNLAQMQFLIGYDLERKRVSFKRKVCA